MAPLSHTRKFTCRYWALGPGCPNVNPSGVITCDYAHYDTGRLASHHQQRGTCLTWAQRGVCTGMHCPYEHRQTGVTGLNQGPLELSGTEIEIANAAFNAGFDTHDHESLFRLIWAVKRLSLKVQKAARFGGGPRWTRPPPPFHPVYPDRYRPSGVGDNTKRKRNVIDDEPPEFHPTKPLGSRVTETPANSSKRRRVDPSSMPVPVPAQILMAMGDVKSRFAKARKTMNISQDDLKSMFDKYYQVFDDDKIMAVLEELAKNMDACFDGAKAGMETIDRAIEWLRESEKTTADTVE